MNGKPSVKTFDYPDSELAFGVVAPVGTDLSQLRETLEIHFRRFKYRLNSLKLSDSLGECHVRNQHRVAVAKESEFRRIWSLMDAGNKTREVSGLQEIMALYAASALNKYRKKHRQHLIPATVHLFDSF